jgi:hypothetical protein
VFLIQNKIVTGSHLSDSLSLSALGPLVSALPPPGVPCAALGDTVLRRTRAIKAPADSATVRSRHLCCPSRAAASLSERLPIMHVRMPLLCCPSTPCHWVTPRSSAGKAVASPRLTLKPAAAPHHPLPVCAGARCEELPHRRNFGRLHHRDPLHGERIPEHPLATFFSGYTCA